MSDMPSETSRPVLNHVELAAEVVAAYVARNSVPTADLPNLIKNVHDAISRLGATPEPAAAPEELKPAVPIRKSVQDDYIISLENGQKFKSLKRHLMTTYGMTPQEYREKWGLPKDYPMVAPAYAKSRSELAKSLGLGRKAKEEEIEEAAAEPIEELAAPEPAPAPKRRGRSKAAAAA